MRPFILFICLLIFAPFAHAQMNYGDPTLNNGFVEWQWNINVGVIPRDTPYIANFLVRNIGNRPLILNEVISGCHCTVTDFTRNSIAVGDSTHIKVTFDAHRIGDFYKTISVKTNLDPENYVVLSLQGKVE